MTPTLIQHAEPEVLALLRQLPDAPAATRAADAYLAAYRDRCRAATVSDVSREDCRELLDGLRTALLSNLAELVEVCAAAGHADGVTAAVERHLSVTLTAAPPRGRPWWELVPPATLERFTDLVTEARRLGRRPRPLLLADERRRLDLVEAELDALVEELRPALAAADTPALIAGTVELVRDARGLQRHYRRTLCPATRRELPAMEGQLDEKLGQLADVVGVLAAGRRAVVRGEGGAA